MFNGAICYYTLLIIEQIMIVHIQKSIGIDMTDTEKLREIREICNREARVAKDLMVAAHEDVDREQMDQADMKEASATSIRRVITLIGRVLDDPQKSNKDYK